MKHPFNVEYIPAHSPLRMDAFGIDKRILLEGRVSYRLTIEQAKWLAAQLAVEIERAEEAERGHIV